MPQGNQLILCELLFVTGWLNPDITLAELSEAGAKRISVGGALSRLTLSVLIKAGQDMQELGSFSWKR